MAIAARSTALAIQVSASFQNFILDFVCLDQRLIVEIDGSQHASSSQDEMRSRVLASEGFKVARYWNNDVLPRPTAVLEDILTKLAG